MAPTSILWILARLLLWSSLLLSPAQRCSVAQPLFVSHLSSGIPLPSSSVATRMNKSICRVPRNQVPNIGPRLLWPICCHSLSRATLRGGVADQVPIEQPCETERPTNLSRNIAKRSSQPTLCRETLRGGAADQVPTEQPYEVERPTSFLSNNPARRSGRPTFCRTTL